MRIVFMGTPPLAATVLEQLIDHHQVVGVYTRPDAVRGRGKQLVPSPVKEVAVAAGIPVYTPATLKDGAEVETLKELAPEAICVAAYGALLPPEVLSLPVYGCLNVHASLLPRWRGAAPIQRAILAGDAAAGVCIMQMEAGMDTGPYCLCKETPIDSKTADQLTQELAALGAEALLEALDGLAQGTLRWTHQDESLVTQASKIEKHELDIGPDQTVAVNLRCIQASDQAHPSRCRIAGRRVTVMAAEAAPQNADALSAASVEPGSVLLLAKKLWLGCSDGAFVVTRLKPDGKREMEASAFAAGVPDIRSGVACWTRDVSS